MTPTYTTSHHCQLSAPCLVVGLSVCVSSVCVYLVLWMCNVIKLKLVNSGSESEFCFVTLFAFWHSPATAAHSRHQHTKFIKNLSAQLPRKLGIILLKNAYLAEDLILIQYILYVVKYNQSSVWDASLFFTVRGSLRWIWYE